MNGTYVGLTIFLSITITIIFTVEEKHPWPRKQTVTEKAWAEQEHATFKEPKTLFQIFVGDNGHRGRRAREGE